jgi:2-polyprenyl-3-methyl-5-hydroxy-6-metoxy-1,4-benzoquinol methylase
VYDRAYFQDQIRKSDDKVAWQYGRLLSFARPGNGSILRVLDAGCGAGPGLRYLSLRGHRAFGSDLVEYPLRVAHEFAPEVRLTQSDLNQGLPFADNSFDVILLSEVIEHVRDAGHVLGECLRVLDWEGAIALTTPNLWDARRLFFPLLGRVWSGEADPTHVQLFNPRKLQRALRDAGFAEVDVRAGFKPLKWISSRRFGLRMGLPYPPWIGNTLVARGYKIPNAGPEARG